MKRNLNLIIGLVGFTALAVGCGKKDGGEGGGGGGGGSETVDIAQVGLKATAPKGANVSDGIGGGAMIQAPGLVAGIEEASDTTPKTPEEAKSEADMYSPKNTNVEKLDDGFVFTFENKGAAGTNYWVQVRREIGGKAYWCTTTSAQKEQQSNAVAFCKSLTK